MVKIEAKHQFNIAANAKQWAENFNPSENRLLLFETIYQEIRYLDFQPSLQVLELGVGPGFLAAYLLERLPDVKYQGLDFAFPMLELAAERLKSVKNRVTLTQADLTTPDWTDMLVANPQVVVSTWALHDLMSKQYIKAVYDTVRKILVPKGVLLNGDFIKPEKSHIEYEPGRIRPSEHLSLLGKAGFQSWECLKHFETDIECPTTSNNYSCFKAVK